MLNKSNYLLQGKKESTRKHILKLKFLPHILSFTNGALHSNLQLWLKLQSIVTNILRNA